MRVPLRFSVLRVLVALVVLMGLCLPSHPALAQGSQVQSASPEDIQERGGVCYRTGESVPYTGMVRDTHESGKPRLEARYQAGRLVESHVWYANGQMAEEVRVTGDVWVIRRFSEDGRIEEETSAQFRNGRKVSERSTIWHENGQMRIEAGFENGKLHGPLKEYESDGTLLRDEVYDNGVMIKKNK